MIDRFRLHRPRRFPLPMSSGVSIFPGQSATLIARPQTNKFYPERLLIKEATLWQIDAIRVGDRPDALVQGLPGKMFGPTAPGRFPGCGEIEIPPGGDLIVELTYTGPREAGIPFEACVFGSDDQTPPLITSTTYQRSEKKIATARSGSAILAGQSTKLCTDPMKCDTWPCRLVIKEASDWIINDVCVGEVSIFAESGDVPGSMFSEGTESVICLGRIAAGETFSVVATYIGHSTGSEFMYELYGTFNESEANALPIAAILPMSSGVNILPERSAQITGRCQRPDAHRRGIGLSQGFLAERIVIEGATDWSLNDIKIGRTSQLAQSGDMPGLAFNPGVLGGAVSFDVARAGIDVVIVTTHVGPREVGAAFVCGILGSVIELAKAEPSPPRGRILSVKDL